MVKHISSAEYKYIPIEYAVENTKSREIIRKQEVIIKKLFKENVKLRSKRAYGGKTSIR